MNIRGRQAEAIDRLLHVADYEQGFPPSSVGRARNILVLNGVYVLILIDHDLAKARAGFACKGCGLPSSFVQKLGGKVLKVCKIDLCPAALFGAVGSCQSAGSAR